jgi:hypothetical protein
MRRAWTPFEARRVVELDRLDPAALGLRGAVGERRSEGSMRRVVRSTVLSDPGSILRSWSHTSTKATGLAAAERPGGRPMCHEVSKLCENAGVSIRICARGLA